MAQGFSYYGEGLKARHIAAFWLSWTANSEQARLVPHHCRRCCRRLGLLRCSSHQQSYCYCLRQNGVIRCSSFVDLN